MQIYIQRYIFHRAAHMYPVMLGLYIYMHISQAGRDPVQLHVYIAPHTFMDAPADT